MKIIETNITDLLIIETDLYKDNRGIFSEFYNYRKLKELGFKKEFFQDNIVYSKKNVLRGLHYQIKHQQGKLVKCIEGTIFDVAVDLRKNSKTYLNWYGLKLSKNNHRQLYVPEGFAHGYCVLSRYAIVSYKCTDYYYPNFETGIIWNDPIINIDWPILKPTISDKDKNLNFFKN